MSKKKKQKNKVSKVSGTSVSNPALKKAMLDLKEGSTPEKQNALSMALVKAKFLVPCKVEEVQPGIAAVKYMMMNTNEGAAYFPIFTDQKEADRFAGGEVQPQFIVRTLKDYAEMLEKQENVAGLVVNPGEDSLVINKELALMLASGRIPMMEAPAKKEAGPARYVEPAVYPTKLVNAVYDYCITLPEVSRVWMKEKITGISSSMIFFVEADSKDRKILANILEKTIEIVGETMNTEVEFVSDKMMHDVIQDAVPLYDRELEL